MNHFFDKIFVFNLLKRPQKAVTVLHHLDKMGICCTLFPAVDGAREVAQKKISLPEGILPGEYGYYQSWYKALKESRVMGYNHVLFLDDDVWFHRKFKFTINNLEKGWLICYLGASQHWSGIDWTTAEKKGYYHPNRTDGSFAVALSKEGIKRVWKEFCRSSLPRVVDSDILRTVVKDHPNKCYVMYPNLVVADVTFSDIRGGRSMQEIADKFRWKLDDYWINDQSFNDLVALPIPSDKNCRKVSEELLDRRTSVNSCKIPLISVIIACYNAEKTIWAALMSLLNQTYMRLEIIVVNDGSTDRSGQLIAEFAAKVQELVRAPGKNEATARGENEATARGENEAPKGLRDQELVRAPGRNEATARGESEATKGRRSLSSLSERADLSQQRFLDLGTSISRSVVVIDLKDNVGCYRARNIGLDRVSPEAELVAFQDADDVSLPYRLLEQAKVLWQKRCLWVQCLILRTHLNVLDLSAPDFLQQIEQQRVHKKPGGGFRHCCSAVLGMVTGLYRKSLFDGVNSPERFLEVPAGADAEFGERLLRKYANVTFNPGENAVGFLSREGEIKNSEGRVVFTKINSIMYLCHQMNNQNLTMRFPVNRRFCDL